MKTKRIVLTAAVAVLGTGILFAQNNKTQQSRRAVSTATDLQAEKIAIRKTQRLDQIVGLSEEQKVKANEIYLQSATTRAAQRSEEHKAIEAILTPSQKQTFEARKIERAENVRHEFRSTRKAEPIK